MTIRELAHLAGVSHPTVSRALQDSPRLSLRTRERIQALAKEHGYRPHPLVSKLMAQLPHIKTVNRSTLAVVTSYPESSWSPFIREIYRGIQERADALGYFLEEFPLGEHRMSCRRLSDVLYSRGIQGVLIFPLQRSPAHLSLIWPRFTTVAIGRSLASPPLHRVSFSQFENAVLAIRNMRKLGYSRIGLALNESLQSRGGDAYLAAYFLYQQDLPQKDRMPPFVGSNLDPAKVALWLREQRADALLCNYDPPLPLLRAEGFSIPEQLGYVTLDRCSALEEVSGIDQHPRFVGAAAIDMLTAHLHRNELGIPPFSKMTVIKGDWVAGRTVRKVAPRPRPLRNPRG
jgi:LacI family transcriptional regulator